MSPGVTPLSNRAGEASLVGYFTFPSGLLTALNPDTFLINPGSVSIVLGVEFSFSGETCSRARKKKYTILI